MLAGKYSGTKLRMFSISWKISYTCKQSNAVCLKRTWRNGVYIQSNLMNKLEIHVIIRFNKCNFLTERKTVTNI